MPSTTASSAQITETTPPPPNSTNNKAVTAEQDGQTSSRKEDGYPASSQVMYFPLWLLNRLISAGLNWFSVMLKNHVLHRITENFPLISNQI